MVFKIERRLDFFIIFRCYCELMFMQRMAELNPSEVNPSFEQPITFFSYSRWKTSDGIKEALDRLNNRQQQLGIVFKVIETEEVAKVEVKIKRSLLERFITDYLSKIERSTSLSQADEEDKYECNKVIPFHEQREGLMSLILRYYRGDNPRIEIRRFDMDEIETKAIKRGTPYQRFCFEELLLVLWSKGVIEIQNIYTKELSDPDTEKLVIVPVAVMEYKARITYGRLAYDGSIKAILLGDKVLMSAPQGPKPAVEHLMVNFVKRLIIAQGDFVPTERLEIDMMEGVDEGEGYKAKMVFRDLKAKYPEAAELIESGIGRGSKGYRV